MEIVMGILYYMIGALIGCLILSTDIKHSILERRVRWQHVPANLLLFYLLGYSLVWLFVVGL